VILILTLTLTQILIHSQLTKLHSQKLNTILNGLILIHPILTIHHLIHPIVTMFLHHMQVTNYQDQLMTSHQTLNTKM